MKQNMKTGDIIKFGKYDWLVLSTDEERALLLSKDVLFMDMPYHKERTEITWEQCSLREYLNNEFYSSFAPNDKARIMQAHLENRDNLCYGTKGGNATDDYIWLLSLDEVFEYFGDTGDFVERRASTYKGSDACWWLRSPGVDSDNVANVSDNGWVSTCGDAVDGSDALVGVRVALWLNLES